MTTPHDEAAQDNLAWEQQNGSAFQTLIGYRLDEWAPDYAVIVYEVRAEHLNRTGLLHGGVIATLLDTASGYSGCFCSIPGNARHPVTLSITPNFLASARSGRIRVVARRTGGGKSVFFTSAEAFGEDGQLIATASGTFKYLPGSGDPNGVPRKRD